MRDTPKLQRELGVIHAARRIDGQDELQIDRLCGGPLCNERQ